MLFPTIHLNGTSREELVRRYTAACEAVRDALAQVVDAAPNGRDYYPQGDGAIKRAQQEHDSRCDRLRSVLRELEQITEAIVD